jgi:anthranilate phosphoribosyltransferase
MSTIKTILDEIGSRRDLPPDLAEQGFDLLMDGELSPAQAGAFLLGLRAKGETAGEIGAAVRAALNRARLVQGLEARRIDVVGTGGDGRYSFNCSTATALTLAGMGHQVVKHGNRAVSSSSGSADMVEALGLPMLQDPEEIRQELARRGFVFLFAPHFHPAFRHIMPVRKELGVRTLFNLLGPLLNPARPTHLLLGVARSEIMHLMAEALLLAGVERAAVVHGAGGFDELTPFGPNQVVWVGQGSIVTTELDPVELGFKPGTPEDVAVRDKERALDVLRELLSGKGPEPMREMLALNVAVSLHLLVDGMPIGECVERARGALAAGVGSKVLERA